MALSIVLNPSPNRVQVVLDIEYSGTGYHQTTVKYIFAGLPGRKYEATVSGLVLIEGAHSVWNYLVY
jgi:hypothetical protein